MPGADHFILFTGICPPIGIFDVESIDDIVKE